MMLFKTVVIKGKSNTMRSFICLFKKAESLQNKMRSKTQGDSNIDHEMVLTRYMISECVYRRFCKQRIITKIIKFYDPSKSIATNKIQ